MNCSATEVGCIVQRCRNATKKHGGRSKELEEVRKRYQMFHDCTERAAYVALEAELEKVGC